MANVIMIDNVPHRKRRGKLVPIPAEWLGRTVGHKQIHRRYSKCRAKQIESKQDRARDKAVMVQGEEPNPRARNRRTHWFLASGRVDEFRDKFRHERKASHPSNET
jgi:hypothetical protein